MFIEYDYHKKNINPVGVGLDIPLIRDRSDWDNFCVLMDQSLTTIGLAGFGLRIHGSKPLARPAHATRLAVRETTSMRYTPLRTFPLASEAKMPAKQRNVDRMNAVLTA